MASKPIELNVHAGEIARDEDKKVATTANHESIYLVPYAKPVQIQPSPSPDDPLNWPSAKKHLVFGTVCLATFAGIASINVHQLAYITQVKYFDKSPSQLSYSISAGIAGFMGGPVLFAPIASVIGRSSLIFWCMLGSLASNIWGPLMTGENDYIPFVMSRLLAGLFGSVPAIMSSGYIMDLYFLHQRGKAFTVLEVCVLAGAVAAPVFGGFIANSKPWPFVFWWLVAVIGLSVVLVFLFLEETGYDRAGDNHPELLSRRKGSLLRKRLALFFPGTAVVPGASLAQVIDHYVTPFKIGISPVTVIVGLFVLSIYGFAVGLAVVVSIFLQTSEAEGGYGFSPLQNAAFNFSQWISLIFCQICGAYLNDRLPLWISRRNGGAWHLEYRLYPILLVAAASPIGFGLFGAGIKYHLHYMVLALGTFLVIFGACYSTPISVNYITECFRASPLEVAVMMNIYRQALGLALPFIIFPWQDVVGAGWLFGMIAFFCIFVTFILCVVIWKGPDLRGYSLIKESTEDGLNILVSERATA